MRPLGTDLLHDLASELGLGDLGDQLTALCQWAARLEPAEAAESWLGGDPWLPIGVPWPMRMGEPALFVAQIALSDAPFLDVAIGPTVAHRLAFFCWPADVAHGPAGARVLSFLPNATLKRTVPPSAGAGQLPDTPVTLEPEVTLPAWSASTAPVLAAAGLKRADRDRYEELRARMAFAQGAPGPDHRLLGHPRELAADVLAEAALLGHWASDDDDYDAAELEAQAADWRLLLRVDTDPELGIQWPGGVTNYFCVTAADLAVARYDRVTAVFHRSDSP